MGVLSKHLAPVNKELKQQLWPEKHTMKCINCGKESKDANMSFNFCSRCKNAQRQMTNLFQQGVQLEYADGSKETVKVKK